MYSPESPAGVFESQTHLDTAHEHVSFFRDDQSGLRAIISIHSTVAGPALGGTRFRVYPNEAAALRDALRLSQGMTYKAAVAGLPLGGGKAVVIGDPATEKTPELLQAYGRAVESLSGRYITAADLGTTSEDMDEISTVTSHVVGTTPGRGGSGDTGWSTAYGVFQSMLAAAELRWGTADMSGRTVGVEGAGKVGRHLIDLLVSVDARVLVTDPSPEALYRVRDAHPGVRISDSVLDDDLDLYAPCALGSTLTPGAARSLRAQIVCGAANNQLADREVATALAKRGITWVPDYVANAGGLIQANGERLGKDGETVRADIEKLGSTVAEVLVRSDSAGTTTAEAADALAEARLTDRLLARS